MKQLKDKSEEEQRAVAADQHLVYLIDKALSIDCLQESLDCDLAALALCVEVAVQNQSLTRLVEELKSRDFDEEELLVLEQAVDGRVDDRRVRLQELIVEHRSQQVPGEHSQAAVACLREPDQPAVGAELSQFGVGDFAKITVGRLLRGGSYVQLLPLSKLDKGSQH